MIKLTFKQYMEKLAEEKKIVRPTEHVYEGMLEFVLFFKSREKWEYCSIISKEEILGFSSIEDFKMNYCYNCLPVAESPVLLLEDVSSDTGYFTTSQYKTLDGEDIVDESETYQQFLEKTFEGFRTKVLSNIDKIDKTNKTFGEFLTNLFNIVNTKVFASKVKKYLKADLNVGRVEAESELNMKIPFNESYNNKLNKLASEQIDGYTINGKKWFGIKGVTKQIQSDIIITIQNGLRDGKSITEIKNDVNNRFDNISEHRANMIARTETNRILNEGLIVGYKESGLEGGKVVKVVNDNRTSPICMRLRAKYGNNPIGLDEPFIDDETGKAFINPPFHVHCRSRIAFRPL